MVPVLKKPESKPSLLNLSVEEQNLASIPFAVLERRVGKTIGNEKLEAEGKADQVSGAVQKKVGDVKDAVDTLTKKP